MAAIDRKLRYQHELWLGLAQPVDGLLFSLPALEEWQTWTVIDASEHAAFRAAVGIVEADPNQGTEANDEPVIHSLAEFFRGYLGYDDAADGGLLVAGEALSEDVHYYAAEARENVRPDFALRDVAELRAAVAESDATPASRACQGYALLARDLPLGTPFDKPQEYEGDDGWAYPPAQKMERLLRHARVPLGLLCNGRAIRMIYAPHGEATASMTWRLADMCHTDARLLVATFIACFRENNFARPEESHVLGVLRASRQRQAEVTNELAEQVLDAIRVLLQGFVKADAVAGTDNLVRAFRERGDEHVYRGLLTVMLRLVFVLYAEERSLLPVGNNLYQRHLSLLALYEELRTDHGRYPETMRDRRGAWPRLLALFRAIFFGADHDELRMPARAGQLFDPENYPFLEGWSDGGAPSLKTPDRRAQTLTPQVDDRTVFDVLHRLLSVGGERISYRTLDVEQIGSVYERLMGYHVVQLHEPAVCMKPARVWVQPSEVRDLATRALGAFLKDEVQLPKATVKKLKKTLKGADTDEEIVEALSAFAAVEQRSHKGEKVPMARNVGDWILQPGEERRRTSSHYTPRSLTTEVVAKTLDPIMKALGDRPSSEDILDLKICDPAMGSGAFLVECCRYLGRRLEAAWDDEGHVPQSADAHESVENHARRLVAQRCIYGVDKNPMAAELARVSLWLITFSRELPFTFVDHALRCGDSVVGLSLKQARSFGWRVSDQVSLFELHVNHAMDEAIDLRQRIIAMADREDEQSQAEKRLLLDDADATLERARILADVALGAFFKGDKQTPREKERKRRQQVAYAWLERATDDSGEPTAEWLEADRTMRAWAQGIREEHRPFHWMLEFPEVFYAERRDPLAGDGKNAVAYMDAFVGNPPFAGKNNIAAFGGPLMVHWLKEVHPDSHGNADYSAHFYRRCATLLGTHGTMGLIATNTIGQGDTRSTGLQRLVTKEGYRIYAARESMAWPGEAAVTVSVVYLAKGTPLRAWPRRELDGKLVPVLNSMLKPKPERPDPVALVANAGRAYQGATVLGTGFVLTPEERDELVASDARNAERIFPYLGGQELNSTPAQSFTRHVINFGEMPLKQAEQWPDLMEIVRREVKPQRDSLNTNHSTGRKRKENWWLFGAHPSQLFEKLSDISKCVVCARVSKHLVMVQQPTGTLFSGQLCVFVLDSGTALASLQSRIHNNWAVEHSSTMKGDPRYSITDAFETFPFPEHEGNAELEELGERLQEERLAWTMGNEQGLTKLYNALKDPSTTDVSVLALRELHEEVDRAVLRAYGWEDIAVPPYEQYPEDDESPVAASTREAQDAFRDEVLDRLYALNGERAG